MRSFVLAFLLLALPAHAEPTDPLPARSAGTLQPAFPPARPESSDPIAPLPPTLTEEALCAELHRAAKEAQAQRAQVQAELGALAEERKRLEKLAADIARAREELRTEAARLEALARSSKEPAPPPRPEPEQPALNMAQVENLARTVKGMKPENAAAVLARVDPRLAAEVLRAMRPADAAQVIDRLKPELAANLFTALARERETKP